VFSRVVWQCPPCGYSLEGLVEDGRAQCPECGQVWTRRQLAEIQGFFTWPDWRWAWGGVLTLAVMAVAMFFGWPRMGAAAGGLLAWVCASVMMTQMLRPRLGDMGVVFGTILAAPIAGGFTAVCWPVAKLFVI
jgi:hypothetical protein